MYIYALYYYVESDDEYLEDGILKDSNTYWCSRRFSSLLQDPSTHDVTFKTSTKRKQRSAEWNADDLTTGE